MSNDQSQLTPRSSRALRVFTLAVAGLILAACGGGDNDSLRTSASGTAAQTGDDGRAFRLDVPAANACAAPANAVVAENCLPGNSWTEWDISGNGDPSIQGFSTAISYNRGQTAAFKISTNASSYRIDIYRLGFYGGEGARKVASVTPSATLPQTQPSCLSEPSTGLVDCGNWAVSASWTIPSSAVSGVYIAKLTRNDTGGASHIRFIVRNDTGTADVVFQTSDTTWQAYNRYGGNSFYFGQPAGRSYKVSYNRPLLDRGDPWHAFFVNEYPMLRWVEANGYNVRYISGLDTHRSPALLLNNKIFISIGHDEYWSGPQRANVEAARDAGVNLAFFSGNSIYWKTRWEPSIDGSNTPNRTLVSYKETWANAKIDPSPEWTGTWRDPRFSPPADGGRPENALQGTFWLVNCCSSNVMDSYSIQVSSEDGKLRFWRNTGLQSLANGQKVTLTPGILGFEWDTDLDNGFRPTGLFKLSAATYDVPEKMLDFGSTIGPGTVTHNLTLYRAASGALVFGAGTTRWAWGLDDWHDGTGTPVDPRMQQATLNLFADMGVQPRSRQPGLVPATASTDVTPPTATFAQPAAGAIVTGRTTVTIAGTATDSGGTVAGVEVSVDGGQTWHPAAGRANWSYQWSPNTVGAVTLKARAVDDSGNVQPNPVSRSVTVTAPDCPCSIWTGATTPAVASVNDSGPVELGVKFSVTTPGYITGVRFYKGPQNTGVHVGNLWTANGQLLASATFSGESATGWQQVNFATPIYARPGTTYVASYFAPNGGYAADPNYFYSGVVRWPFSVAASTTSGNGLYSYGSSSRFPTSSFQASNYWVDVVFMPTSVTGNDDAYTVSNGRTLTVAAPGVVGNDTDSNGSALSVTLVRAPEFGALSLNAAGSFSYTPSAGFFGVDTFVYRATASNGQSASATVVITVNQDGCPCNVFQGSAVPAVASSGDTSAVELGMKFRSTIPGYVTGVRFYKGTGNSGTHVGNLWTASGQLLASATFANETASGWQSVSFDRPVAITAGVVYVVSYFTPSGNYSYTSGQFATEINSNLLVAPDSSSVNGNGLYSYGGTSRFPNNSYQATNYWVDVSFSPVAAAADGFIGSANQPLVQPAPGLLANDAAAGGGSLVASKFTDPSYGTVVVNADGSFVYTPQPGFTGSDSFTYKASTSSGQFGVGRVTVLVTAPNAPYSIFGSSATPAVASVPDGSVELGMKFTARVPGFVSGVRFYKGAGNTGTHIGNLWTASGQLLATATFVGESASGWQQVNFGSPVAISADTVYVVSYFAPSGGYAFTGNYFGAGIETDLLRAPSSAQVNGNGVYAYGGASRFPDQTWQSGNYWVDVVFKLTP